MSKYNQNPPQKKRGSTKEREKDRELEPPFTKRMQLHKYIFLWFFPLDMFEDRKFFLKVSFHIVCCCTKKRIFESLKKYVTFYEKKNNKCLV